MSEASQTTDTISRTERDYEAYGLKPRINFQAAFSLIVGSILGVGIFITQPVVATTLQNPVWILITWFLGGIITFAGALSMAELGVRMPLPGGEYAYLNRIYGPLWGYLYGFLSLVFTFPGSIAAMATLMFAYQGSELFGMNMTEDMFVLAGSFTLTYAQVYSILTIFILTVINHFGLQHGILLQKFVTFSPILFLIPTSIYILYRYFTNSAGVVWHDFTWDMLYRTPEVSSVSLALIPIFWSYSGWNSALYVGSEIHQPEKTIPRSMTLGVAFITLVYLLLSFVILTVFPVDKMIAAHQSGESIDYFARAWSYAVGENSAVIISGIIFMLILGGLNTTIISGSRVIFAMSRDGFLTERLSRLHTSAETPHRALWVQAGWAIFLVILISNADLLIQVSSLLMLFLSGLTVAGVFFIRKRIDSSKLLRTFGHPVTPLVYILATVGILAGTLMSSDLTAIYISLSLIVAGKTAYWLRKKIGIKII